MTAEQRRIVEGTISSASQWPVETKPLTALLAAHDRYEKALREVHEGATRQLAEPRNHDDDQYALTAIATRVEEALCE